MTFIESRAPNTQHGCSSNASEPDPEPDVGGAMSTRRILITHTEPSSVKTLTRKISQDEVTLYCEDRLRPSSSTWEDDIATTQGAMRDASFVVNDSFQGYSITTTIEHGSCSQNEMFCDKFFFPLPVGLFQINAFHLTAMFCAFEITSQVRTPVLYLYRWGYTE